MRIRKKRTILFVTERRADYSRLKPIMQLVKKSKTLQLRLVMTGLHLSKEFGETRRIVEQDGFHVDAVFPVYRKNDRDDGGVMLRAFSQFVASLTTITEKFRPDIMFCGFDLGAHLAAAIVGAHLNIPVAHIQGGERSGTIDEMLRHATTKFAHLHFVATKESKTRLIRLGEDRRYIFLVGSPSLDTIRRISYPSRATMLPKYGLKPERPLIVFSQHPVTTEVHDVLPHIRASIRALRSISKKQGAQVLAVYSNNDAGGKQIVEELKRSGFVVYPHIPYEDYLRLLRHAVALVGNSSAAIHEAPSFGLPAVNIGTRQHLRERGRNVIDVAYDARAIERAVLRAMTDRKLIAKIRRGKNPYDHGDTARKIVAILETVKLPPVQKILTY